LQRGSDDFVRDELKFAMMREHHTEDGFVDHIIAQAQFYGLTTDRKNIRVETHPDSKSGLTFLAVDVNYSTPVDLYYSTYQLRRHPPSRIYDVLSISQHEQLRTGRDWISTPDSRCSWGVSRTIFLADTTFVSHRRHSIKRKIDNETDRDSDGVRMRWPHPKEGKMRKILLFIGILWTSIPALHAEGSFYTAREFVQMCELYDRYQSAGTDDSVEALRLGICLGYFRGVHVTYQLYELLSDRSQATTRTATRRASALVCIPERATIEETVRVFLKYMKDHPEKLDEGADLMILEALAGAFPCKD
jgi:hypothetical protein